MNKFTLFIIILFLTNTTEAQNKTKKYFCNPIVLGSIPKKALSVQYEYQTSFSNTYIENYRLSPTIINQDITNVQNVRVGYYKPLITKPKTFMTLDIGYWYSKFNTSSNNINTQFERALDASHFHSVSAATTIFKPLNKKNFILLNLSAELNGNSTSFKNIGAKNLLASGAVIYGWKKGVSKMTGVGLLRAYRMGRVIHVPALLWNQNFTTKWGIESLLPARALVRYAPNQKIFWLAGFDLEGTQYSFGSSIPVLNNSFFQRGEIKTRIGIDASINKNLRFTANTGLRIMGRMDWADNYDGKLLLVKNDANINFFMNIGFHLMNINTKRK